jgi:hypothetical protein
MGHMITKYGSPADVMHAVMFMGNLALLQLFSSLTNLLFLQHLKVYAMNITKRLKRIKLTSRGHLLHSGTYYGQ